VAAANALSAMVTGQGYVQAALSPEDHKAAGGALVELLATSDQEVRHAALRALVEVGTVDDMKRIVSLLEDQDVTVRNQTTLALARAFYPNPNVERDPKLDALEKAAGPPLAAALSVPETRGAAIQALSAMKASPAEGRASTDRESEVQRLDPCGRDVATGDSSTPFNGFQGPIEIGQAIDVLSRTGSQEAEPLLVKFLNIINPGRRKACVRGVGNAPRCKGGRPPAGSAAKERSRPTARGGRSAGRLSGSSHCSCADSVVAVGVFAAWSGGESARAFSRSTGHSGADPFTYG